MGNFNADAQPAIQLRFEEELHLPKSCYEMMDKQAMHE